MKAKKANSIRSALLIYIDAEIKSAKRNDKYTNETYDSFECDDFKIELNERYSSCQEEIYTPSTDSEDSFIMNDNSPEVRSTKRKSINLLHSIVDAIKPKVLM